MAIRTQNKRTTRRPAPRQEINPRVLLLAGVGAVSLGRKQAIRTIEEAGDNAVALRKRLDASLRQLEARAQKLTKQAEGDFRRLRKQAESQATALRKQARGQAVFLREQAFARVAPLQASLQNLVDQATVRIAPVLEKAGIVAGPKAKAAPRRSKPARRKAA
jgi:hypothetical protein